VGDHFVSPEKKKKSGLFEEVRRFQRVREAIIYLPHHAEKGENE
jgi:hypothetical protein